MAEELPSFDINLSDQANDKNNFHFENDPDDPYQRTNVIERRGLVHVRCTVRDIIHGQYGNGEDMACSLIVLLFRFDPDDLNRRIKTGRIKVTFFSSVENDPDPEVARIFPDSTYAIYPTKRKVTVGTSGSGNIGGGAGGVEVGAQLSQDRSVERELVSFGVVRGSADTEGRNFGLHNSASWTLLENGDTKSGVPVSLQCAILLKRRAAGEFAASVDVTAHADSWTARQEWVHGVFHSPTKVDPVLFKPSLPPTNRLKVYEQETIDALGGLELDDRSLTDITLRTVWDKAEKHT